MASTWDLREFCFTEQNSGQRKLSIGNVGRVLGFRNAIDAHDKYRETPMLALHDRIMMPDGLFSNMATAELRESAAVRNKSDEIFHELGSRTWPETKGRLLWLVSASEESRVQYPQDLHYDVPEHRELLRPLFHAWIVLCIMTLKLKRFARRAYESFANQDGSTIAIRPRPQHEEVVHEQSAPAVQPCDTGVDEPQQIEWIERWLAESVIEVSVAIAGKPGDFTVSLAACYSPEDLLSRVEVGLPPGRVRCLDVSFGSTGSAPITPTAWEEYSRLICGMLKLGLMQARGVVDWE
ncbi:unnamed protein product [Cercospora beticola]|nr:unnamed protein product [Cercospora beticola]